MSEKVCHFCNKVVQAHEFYRWNNHITCTDCLASIVRYLELEAELNHNYNEAIDFLHHRYYFDELAIDSDIQYIRCDFCDNFYGIDDIYTDTNDMHLCCDCMREFHTCESCGRFVRDYETRYHDWNYYCNECYHELCIEIIHPHSYKPEPIFHRAYSDTENNYYGVEIEIDSGYWKGSTIVNSEAVKILNSIDDRDEEFIYLKHDSSLTTNGSMEIVSHPMTINYHFNEMNWRAVFDTFNDLGYTDTVNTGLHVHIGKSSLGYTKLLQDINIMKLMYFFENNSEELTTLSGRNSDSIGWCDFYRHKIPSSHKYNIYSYYEKASEINNDSKYYMLNTTENTVECRLWRGTPDVDKFYAYLSLTDLLVNAIQDYSIEEIQYLSLSALLQQHKNSINWYVESLLKDAHLLPEFKQCFNRY